MRQSPSIDIVSVATHVSSITMRDGRYIMSAMNNEPQVDGSTMMSGNKHLAHHMAVHHLSANKNSELHNPPHV
jgi:hypothetical protein